MISWGPNSNASNEIESKTERKICVKIRVAIHALENPNEATPPPSVPQYNPSMKFPFRKIPNFKRKHKMTKIFELLEKPMAPQIQKKDSM